jgi:hypothetical protein
MNIVSTAEAAEGNSKGERGSSRVMETAARAKKKEKTRRFRGKEKMETDFSIAKISPNFQLRSRSVF